MGCMPQIGQPRFQGLKHIERNSGQSFCISVLLIGYFQQSFKYCKAEENFVLYINVL